MSATASQAPTATAQASFLWGTWKMRSWTRKVVATGEISDGLGPDPLGWITYTPEGHVMTLIVRSGRRAPSRMPPTDAEKAALFDSMLAYAGTYTVDDEKVVHHLKASWNQVWGGTEQVRFHRHDGDTLTLWTPVIKDPYSGEESVHTIIFERVR
jgi:hypothetical protein